MSSGNRLSTIVMLARGMFLTAGPLGAVGKAARYPAESLGFDVDLREATPNAIPANSAGGIAGYRFEPTGLSMLRPYVRGKNPVVLIHGLWSNPRSWTRMLQAFESDPVLQDRYQFWVFGYSTGEPILYSAYLLRQALRKARQQYDDAGTDPAFGRMVLIGYSMGGLLAKLMAQDSQSRLWELISAQSPDQLLGPPDACESLRQSFLFKPLPEVQRLVLIATPHRGSFLNQGAVPKIAARFVRHTDDLKTAHRSLLASNQPGFFRDAFRRRLATSIDQLAWEHPLLLQLHNLGIDPAVKYHSIIADLRSPPLPGGGDGVVPYKSAHLDGASSELIFQGGHLCQDHPQIIQESRRILLEHISANEFSEELAPLAVDLHPLLGELNALPMVLPAPVE
jgi:pimeloyl-ACP methyl ester carboxylesterase